MAGLGEVRGKQLDANPGPLQLIGPHFHGRTGNETGDGLADQNALAQLLGQLFNAGGFVCGLTHHGEIDPLGNPDIAINDIPDMHPQPIIKRRFAGFFARGVELIDVKLCLGSGIKGRNAGGFDIVFIFVNRENCQCRIADIAQNLAAVFQHRPGGCRKEIIHFAKERIITNMGCNR